MLRQLEMSFFGEIRAEVKCVECVAVWVVFARDIVAFVSGFFAGSGKEAHVCLDVLAVGKFGFSGLTGWVFPSRCKEIFFAQGVMFKVERILDIVFVESVIVHASDDENRRELTGKQFLVIAVQAAGRDRVGLAVYSLDRVLG